MSERMSHQEALEKVYTDRLKKEDGFVEVPVSLFVDQIDVNMPQLAGVPFFKKDGAVTTLIKEAEKPYSPLAISLNPVIWVREQDLPLVRRFAESLILRGVGGKGPALSEKKLEILRKSAIVVVEDLFNNPSPENIQKSQKVVSSFVHVLMKDPMAYLPLSRLSSHDHYTLQHSVGAAVNSIILARKIGIREEKDLLEVGLGGLLHDIGKVHVKKEIINKPGPLNDEEWKEMKQHSLMGYEIIKENASLSERTKRAVLEHHEDKSGKGYPHGKTHDQVDIFARIVAIADIFNALTTNRSYSTARTPFEAFKLMGEKMRDKLDEKLFEEMVRVYGGKVD